MWTVLGEDYRVVEPVERYLQFLRSTDRSPNTVKSYAKGLELWWTFLDAGGRRTVVRSDDSRLTGNASPRPATRSKLETSSLTGDIALLDLPSGWQSTAPRPSERDLELTAPSRRPR
ncbi:site-specific integrase [Nonomuraea sp. NPDC005983]|uniref:site-specific integrase n=1 Tax=Nonomuraea sp. NPDC005983 TaxID=3155595 RepID=UPI0033B81CE7